MTPAGEFSHSVTVEPWPEDGISIELAATAAECDALKARFDLVDLPSLGASVGIEKRMTEWVLTGRIKAVVAQTCVVTLQPVTSSLDVGFERRYRRREINERLAAAGGDTADDDDGLDIDILDTNDIDVGEVIAEEFYLALDPYPRSSDADQVMEGLQREADDGTSDRLANPFEKLRQH